MPFSVEVACETETDGEERPIAFRLGGKEIAVTELLDRWPGEDHAYVKLRGEDGALYILRRDLKDGGWELWLYERG